MVKSTKLDIKRVTRDLFNTDRSHKAALLAVSLANKIMFLAKRGYLMVYGDSIVKPVYCMDVNSGGTFALYLNMGENTKGYIVGCTVDDNGKTYTTKQEVREHFNKITAYRITDKVKFN